MGAILAQKIVQYLPTLHVPCQKETLVNHKSNDVSLLNWPSSS